MSFLVLPQELLAEAGIEPPTTVDDLIDAAAKLTTRRPVRAVPRQRRRRRVLGGMALWAAGADYLTDDNQVGFANDAVYASFGKLQRAVPEQVVAARRADRLDATRRLVHQRARPPCSWTGLWTLPADPATAIGDDFDVMPWPELSASVGGPSLPVGAFGVRGERAQRSTSTRPRRS